MHQRLNIYTIRHLLDFFRSCFAPTQAQAMNSNINLQAYEKKFSSLHSVMHRISGSNFPGDFSRRRLDQITRDSVLVHLRKKRTKVLKDNALHKT